MGQPVLQWQKKATDKNNNRKIKKTCSLIGRIPKYLSKPFGTQGIFSLSPVSYLVTAAFDYVDRLAKVDTIYSHFCARVQ